MIMLESAGVCGFIESGKGCTTRFRTGPARRSLAYSSA